MLDKAEMEQLNKGWIIIMIIWGSLLASLGVYLAVCKVIEKDHVPILPDGDLSTVKPVLYGVSIVMLAVIYFFRRYLLNSYGNNPMPETVQISAMQPGNPAVGKYLVVIIVSMAFSESIGIYGLVLFFLGKDMAALYQLLALSAIAMVFFGPRKNELIELATAMKSTERRDQITQ